MPSENKTENYGLNSWSGDDKPKREDFYADNQIIDEALAEKADKESPAFTGTPTAAPNTAYTTPQLRNIILSTTDLTAGLSPLANGALHIVYE